MIDLNSRQRMPAEQMRGIINRYAPNGSMQNIDRAQAFADIHHLLIEVERRRHEIDELTNSTHVQHIHDQRVMQTLQERINERDATIQQFQEHLASFPSMAGEGRMYYWEKTARQLLGMPI